MTDPTSSAAIARRLTPRQREALRWLPADGSWLEHVLPSAPSAPEKTALAFP